jgi:anti-anti-sigma factor
LTGTADEGGRVTNINSIQQQPHSEHDATIEARSPRPGEHDATIQVRSPRSGIAQISLGGEHDLSSAVRLRETIDDALASCSHLVVDVSAAEFIDSSTIKVLVNAQKAARDRDCRFNLVLSTTPIVERVLEITGVLPALNRVHTLEEALRPPGAPS